MAQPATGSAILTGWRRELAFGIPDLSASRVFLHPLPQVGTDLVRAQGQSDEINAGGFPTRGIPGPITGPIDLAVYFNAATLLEPLEALFGSLAPTEPETDVFQYVATPDRFGPAAEVSYDLLVCEPPVDRRRLFGFRPSTLTLAIGNNTAIPARMAGFVAHGTHLGAAVADAGNTGSYAMGPEFRGILKDRRDGEYVALQVSRDVGGGGLQFKAERVPEGSTPTFPGAAIDAAYDSAGNGTWQNLVVAYQLTGTVSVTATTTALTGSGTRFLSELRVGQYLYIGAQNVRIAAISSNTAATLAVAHVAGASGAKAHRLLDDAGVWDENGNRDPGEIVWVGTSTDHGDLDIDDTFTFPTEWSDPSPTYIAAQRFTSAHWLLDWRRVGETAWNAFQVLSGQFVIANPITPGQGSGSRYYQTLDRDQKFAPTLQLVRKYLDRTFLEFSEQHQPFEMRLQWLGQKLGTGAYRESIAAAAPFAEIMTRAKPVQGAAAVQETINIGFKAADDGSEPLEITCITDREYTPLA